MSPDLIERLESVLRMLPITLRVPQVYDGPDPWGAFAADLREAASVLSSLDEGLGAANASRAATGPLPRIAPKAEPSGTVRLACEKCGRTMNYDRSDPDIPAWVATLSQSHCDADGCDTGDRLIETWLDADGVALDPAENSPNSPSEPSAAWSGLRLYTRRTDSGAGSHVIVEAERADGSSVELIREFADITDTTIDHWARLP